MRMRVRANGAFQRRGIDPIRRELDQAPHDTAFIILASALGRISKTLFSAPELTNNTANDVGIRNTRAFSP
jgi:hypothetical protein